MITQEEMVAKIDAHIEGQLEIIATAKRIISGILSGDDKSIEYSRILTHASNATSAQQFITELDYFRKVVLEDGVETAKNRAVAFLVSETTTCIRPRVSGPDTFRTEIFGSIIRMFN